MSTSSSHSSDLDPISPALIVATLAVFGSPTLFLLYFVTSRHYAGYETFGATGPDVAAGIGISQLIVVGLAIATVVVAGYQGVRHRAVRTLAITTVAATIGLALIPAIFGTTHVAAATGLVLASLAVLPAVAVTAAIITCIVRTGTWDTLRYSIGWPT